MTAGLAIVLAVLTTLATLIAAGGSSPASASTLNGVATTASPGSLAYLASGGSDTLYTVALPANAACTGDTASHGYHVYSYLVKKGTNVATTKFGEAGPSQGLGIFDSTGSYYGPVNTAQTTGQIIGIPQDFEWGPVVSGDGLLSTILYSGTTGVWEGGLACANSSGVLTDNWNTQITFTAKSTDPHGFVWSAVPGVVSAGFHITTTSVPDATIGKAYSDTLEATGGTLPYKWKKITKPPKGLKVKSGLLSGTVSTKVAPGTYSFEVEAFEHTKPKQGSPVVTLKITVLPA
jgi:hypothetical protein